MPSVMRIIEAIFPCPMIEAEVGTGGRKGSHRVFFRQGTSESKESPPESDLMTGVTFCPAAIVICSVCELKLKLQVFFDRCPPYRARRNRDWHSRAEFSDPF